MKKGIACICLLALMASLCACGNAAADTTIAAGYFHTVALKEDGTVVAVGDNDHGRCDVEGWTDIVAIAAGDYHTVGLKEDGTVVAVGDNDYGRCDVEGWTKIQTP